MAISDELRKLVDPNNECCCEHCLSNMCKEWALRKNYILASESNTYGGICNMSISSMDVDVFYNIQSTTRANTEVEAVIKACEWILDNKGNK